MFIAQPQSELVLHFYRWGVGINLFVALFVFPISSEKQLRQTLVLSLQHVGHISLSLAECRRADGCPAGRDVCDARVPVVPPHHLR